MNILAILHHSGFADRVPPVLGIVRHWGNMRDPVRRAGEAMHFARMLWEMTDLNPELACRPTCPLQPLYGYAMPAYPYGSLASLIRDTCDRCARATLGLVLHPAWQPFRLRCLHSSPASCPANKGLLSRLFRRRLPESVFADFFSPRRMTGAGEDCADVQA